MSELLRELDRILIERKSAPAHESYVASLYSEGLNKILEKIGEESTEVVIAAKDARGEKGRQALVNEVADLWFHSLICLAHFDLSSEDVLSVLAKRQGLSGLVEKASRQQK
jgi:phosphoribosyl-ATP pyrophosphohydrolase